MYLPNPQIKYKNDAGDWVKLSDILALDINISNKPGRPIENAEGIYTSDFINNVRVIYKHGVVTKIDDLKTDDIIELQIFNGSQFIKISFSVSSNTIQETKKDYKILLLFALPNVKQEIVSDATKISATWGNIGGDITDQTDLMDKFDAFYNKSEVDDKLDEKLSLSGGTMTGDVKMNGHLINMVGGRIANVTVGSSDDAIPRKYVDQEVATRATKEYVDQQDELKVSKVDTTSSYGLVYGVNKDGTQETITVTENGNQSSLIKTLSDGNAILTATPTTTTHIVNKGYVDTKLTGKQNVLTQGDGIKIVGDTISADDDYLATQTELEAKQDKLTAGANITITPDNVISATGLVSVQWGDIAGTLSDQTDLNGKFTTVENNIINEETRAKNVEKDLEDYCDSLDATKAAQTDLTSEITNRTSADTNLQNQINLKQDKLTAGTGIAISSDNTISSTVVVDVTKSYVDGKDATLQSNIDKEISDRTTADSNLSGLIATETTNRIAGDNTLQTNIDKKQDKLTAGANITISAENVISATSGNPVWGRITGDIVDQYDLIDKLDLKQDKLTDIKNSGNGISIEDSTGKISISNVFSLSALDKYVKLDAINGEITASSSLVSLGSIGGKSIEIEDSATFGSVYKYITTQIWGSLSVSNAINCGTGSFTSLSVSTEPTTINDVVNLNYFNAHQSPIVEVDNKSSSELPSASCNYIKITSPSGTVDERKIVPDITAGNNIKITSGEIATTDSVVFGSGTKTASINAAGEINIVNGATYTTMDGKSIKINKNGSNVIIIDANFDGYENVTAPIGSFSTKLTCPLTPTDNDDAASKKYVDDKFASLVLQQVYDMIYPVGSTKIVLSASDVPTVPTGVSATWEVSTTYDGRSIWFDSTLDPGSEVTPSLPDVWGRIKYLFGPNDTSSAAIGGAFERSSLMDTIYTSTSGTARKRWTLNFLASDHNSIYGQEAGANVVRPTASSAKVYVRTA